MRVRHMMPALLAVVLALGIAGPNARAASEASDPAAAFASLKGKFLVANPGLPDPRFAHAVILMLRHDADGAFGLVINRPLGVAEVTPDEPDRSAAPDVAPTAKQEPLRLPAFLGGPVEPNKAFIIHTPDYKADDTMQVAEGVAVTANVRILQDMADGKGPKRTLYVVGYSGWGAGQLEAELKRNSWYQAPVDDGLIFSGEDTDTVWEQAMEMRLRGI